MKPNTAVGLLILGGALGLLFPKAAPTATECCLNLRADEITSEAAIMKVDLVAPLSTMLAYFGTRDGGTDPAKWECKIVLGVRTRGTVEVPVEGLQPGTTYYYTFQGRSTDGEKWATAPAKFTTRPAVPMQDNSAYLKRLDPRDIPVRGFISSRSARAWEEGLVSGNGKMGALVLSRPLDEKIILTHEKLYLPFDAPLPPVNMAALLPEIRQLIFAGKYAEAAEMVMAEARKENYGSDTRWTDSFLPAVDLLVQMDPGEEIRNYVRSVDFSTGVATVRWEDDRGVFSRHLFVSRADNVVVLSIEGPRHGALNCDLQFRQRPTDKWNYGRAQEHVAFGIAEVEIRASPGWLTYQSSFARSAGGYQGVARVVVRGGSSRAAGRKLEVRGADDVLVMIRIEPVAKYVEADICALQKDVESVHPDFQSLLQRHARIHGAIFHRVKLDLHGGAERDLPIEELQAKSNVEKPSAALLEKVFDAGRYTILSATGDWPPNLQGKWTGTWGPAWSGDYTLDGNAEIAVASMLNGNMPELMLSFFRYVEGLIPAMRQNALRMFGARGVVMPSRASTHGYNNHFSVEYPLAFWTAGAGWVAHYFYDYYLYTGDRKFLAGRAVPFMKEAALFYEDFLIEGPDGKYIFNPSYSPENTPRNTNSQATINSTMDIAVARDLLTNLIAACETLNTAQGAVARWKAMLAKLPDYLINSDGAVKEWAWPTLEDNYEHRHLSHLYPLYFGIAPDVADHPTLLAAFRRAAEGRLEYRMKKGGGEMAFGMVQLGQVATSLGDSQTAYAVVTGLAHRNYYNNLMSSHDPGPAIFNADASGGLPDVIIRMLVQSEVGRVDLLPALPEPFASGEIEGVLARGQIVIKRLQWSPQQCTVVLNSERAQTITLTVPKEITAVTPASNNVQSTGKANQRTVILPANSDVELMIAMKEAGSGADGI